MPSPSHLPWRGLAHLLVVYVVWGSTYLAMRETALGGFPPLQMVASRVCVAAAILMVLARLFGHRIGMARREIPIVAATGILLWVGGNGMVALAEKNVASGFAALVIGSTPIWPALFEFVLDRRRPTWRMALSLFTGFCGLAVLFSPMLARDARGDLVSALTLLLATFCWACGSVLQQRRPVKLEPLAASAWQHAFGGLAMLAVALAAGESPPAPTPVAWAAWAYLLVFGSLISFTSYIIVVRTLPMQVVMTYAYVNPVTAVVLGWLVLREPITPTMVAGMALVIAGVAGIFHERFQRRRS